MKLKKQFSAGDKATYVDLFHVVVLSQEGSQATVSMWGRGPMWGVPVIQCVSVQWLEHGWNDIKGYGE